MQGIALKSNGAMQFQYRLLPSDTNWITVAANQNVVRFSLLNYGSYIFESRVINEDGVASTTIAQQQFVILKPWYLQGWFIVLSLIVFASLLFAFYKYRLHLQQEKFAFKLQNATVQEELRKSQLASLKSQMNPHFMFNALNSIQEFIILNDKQKANMYMGKFADLMRMTLDMSNKESVSLQDELKCLNLYLELESLRFEDSFNYEISVADNVIADEIQLPSMLIQPYIENAVKHGLLHKSKDRKLKVAFALINNDTLNCIIEDNGIGRKRSLEINSLRHKKHTSFATGATQNRLELLNYNRAETISVQFTDLYDNTNTGIGTTVCINIPIK